MKSYRFVIDELYGNKLWHYCNASGFGVQLTRTYDEGYKLKCYVTLSDEDLLFIKLSIPILQITLIL